MIPGRRRVGIVKGGKGVPPNLMSRWREASSCNAIIPGHAIMGQSLEVILVTRDPRSGGHATQICQLQRRNPVESPHEMNISDLMSLVYYYRKDGLAESQNSGFLQHRLQAPETEPKGRGIPVLRSGGGHLPTHKLPRSPARPPHRYRRMLTMGVLKDVSVRASIRGESLRANWNELE